MRDTVIYSRPDSVDTSGVLRWIKPSGEYTPEEALAPAKLQEVCVGELGCRLLYDREQVNGLLWASVSPPLKMFMVLCHRVLVNKTR